MELLVVILLFVGLAGIIGNQYSGLRKMDAIQRTLEEISQSLKEKGEHGSHR